MSAALSPLRVDRDRLWNSLMTMAEIGATSRGGSNRQALTDEDKAGRDLFVQWGRALGCGVDIDAVGNIFLRRLGSDPSLDPVLIGSHLDTQPTGGRFDGVYGVLAGLEVLRTLQDHGVTTARAIEVASWTNEEGCRFAPAMLGSGVVAGTYTLEYAYSRTDKAGLRFGAELERIGYRGALPARPRAFRAMFEAHIEQGPILEQTGTTIGAVTGIQGAYWFDVTLEGVSCHAGPTPMESRRDPWRAATPIIEGAFALAARDDRRSEGLPGLAQHRARAARAGRGSAPSRAGRARVHGGRVPRARGRQRADAPHRLADRHGLAHAADALRRRARRAHRRLRGRARFDACEDRERRRP